MNYQKVKDLRKFCDDLFLLTFHKCLTLDDTITIDVFDYLKKEQYCSNIYVLT